MPENGNKEVLEAIQTLATHMDKRFSVVDTRFEESDREAMLTRTELRRDIGVVGDGIKIELSNARSEMAEGFNSVEHLIREEDKKIDRLTEKLVLKKVISDKEMREVMELGPFPAGS
jgi:hypothetical protein